MLLFPFQYPPLFFASNLSSLAPVLSSLAPVLSPLASVLSSLASVLSPLAPVPSDSIAWSPLPNSPLFLSPFRNLFRHLIQFQALLPGNSLFLHMVIPGANLQQQPLRAGLKTLPTRLIQSWKPVLPQKHDTIPLVHSLAQNLLLL